MSSSTSRTAFRLLILFIAQISLTTAATLSFDWNVTWVTANPTGNFSRPVVGINGQWPTPVINATKGDRIIVNLYNGLGNESTSLHFHGLFQNGSNTMDGPGMVTQCNMLPGHSMTYNFTLDQTGLYWYHSHTNGQYSDGFRQAIAIQDPVSPYAGKYDEERIITVSDWYYQQVPILLKQFISVSNPTGAEPIPNAALLNDTSNFQMDVEPGKTYLLRFANVGGFASQYVWIEGHTMRIVEVDGVWVDEAETDMFYIAVAQRYSVLVTMKNETSTNFPIVASMDTTLFDTIPKGLNWNVTGHLVYDTSAEMPAATLIDQYDAYDDVSLVPVDGEKALKEADHIITLDMKMNDLGNGANYAMFNNKSYVYPKVPALYTALSAGQLATNPAVYGADSQSFVLNRGDVVDIVLNNFDTGKHPFHLHGHQFQVLQRSAENAGTWNASTAGQVPAVPMRRDTLVVRPLGNFQIRYVADNPGVWFFHCHITWHLATGLAITLIEAPLDLQKNLTIPQSHKDVCAAAGVPIIGNAAGNTENYLDLAGQNMEVHPLPGGFTTKGYVALAFSCLSGGLGLVAIAWYGMAPIQTSGQP